MGVEFCQDKRRGEGSFGGAVVNDHDLGVGYFVVLRGAVTAGAVNVLLGGKAFVEAPGVACELFGGGDGGLAAGPSGWWFGSIVSDLSGDGGVLL